MLNASVVFFVNIAISISFNHDGYDYLLGCFGPWSYILNYELKISEVEKFGLSIRNLPGCFCPWTFF